MNFRQHVQSDRAKWAVVTVAILALAVLITGLMTSWFKDFNPYCWFGHTYDEETHVCTKCGALLDAGSQFCGKCGARLDDYKSTDDNEINIRPTDEHF